MSHTVVNLSRRPVSIRLNTGITRHIPPRASLTGILDGEIRGNPRIEKLLRQRVITVRETAAGPRSRDMSANQAVEHIQHTDAADLRDFISEGEDRVTIRRAFEEKHPS